MRLMVEPAVGGVDGAEHQVAGLGGMYRGLERLDVAQLADQNDVGILPHRVLEGLVPVAARPGRSRAD